MRLVTATSFPFLPQEDDYPARSRIFQAFSRVIRHAGSVDRTRHVDRDRDHRERDADSGTAAAQRLPRAQAELHANVEQALEPAGDLSIDPASAFRATVLGLRP